MGHGVRTGAHDFRLLPAATIGWAATALATSAPSVWSAVAAAAVTLIAAKVHRRTLVALSLCAIAALCASVGWRVAQVESSPVTAAAQANRSGTVELQVRRDARAFDRRGTQQAVVEVLVRQLDIADQRYRVRVAATAFVDGESDDLVVGRRFKAVASLSEAERRDQAATLDVVRREPARSGGWGWELADRVRDAIAAASEPMPDGARALVPALVDGDTSAVDEELAENFRRTGLTHLMAVSGTNVTIVLGSMLALARATGASKQVLWAVAAGTLIAFVMVARPDPSVVRAAAMGAVGVAALGYGGRGGVRALCVAILALLFVDPWLGRAPGFVLSVAATAGILLLGPPLTERLQRWMPRWLALMLAVPLAAQLACTPPLAALSGEISLVAVLANMLAGPLVAPATVFGLAGGLVAIIWVPAGQVVAWPAGLCASWIVQVARSGAQVAGATVDWSAPWQVLIVVVPVATWVAWYLAVRPVLAMGTVLGLLVVMLRPPQPGWPPPGWVMVACDVGQGDATVLNAGDVGGQSTAVVVDAGPDRTAVDQCLDRLRIDRVALLVLSHQHADHIDGVGGVSQGRPIATMVGGPTSPRVRQVSANESFSVGEVSGVAVWPPATKRTVTAAGSGSTMNDASVVLRADVRGVSMLLTGDIEAAAQDQIVRTGARLDADVLKMPHHGSADQSPKFLEAAGARIVTISAGKDNEYGHPAPAALAMLREQSVQPWRTDVAGDIAVVARGNRAFVVTRR